MKKIAIESYLFSIRAITVPMLFVIIGVSIKASILFNEGFFKIENDWLRASAAIFIGVAYANTLLMVTVNSELLNYNKKIGFPEFFFIANIMMMLLIFGVFGEATKTPEQYIQRIFLSVIFGLIEYVYSKLFVKKYESETVQENLKETNEILVQDLESQTKANEGLQMDLESQREAIADLEKYKEGLKCKKCGKQHYTVSGYRTCKHEDLKRKNYTK